MKKNRLKEIVSELQGASEMHLKQSKEIAEHIDDMGSPAKMTSPLKKIGMGGLFGLTSKLLPEGAKVIEKAKDLTFDDVAEAVVNYGSLGLKGAGNVASMMLNTNSAYGGTYSDDPRFKNQFLSQMNDGGPLPEYAPPTDDYELPQLGNGPLKKMSCWKGYEAKGKKKSPSGKKTKGGKTKMVNNCVKK